MNTMEIKRVPIDSIVPNSYNPNEMAPGVFNQLADDIKQDDMDQPIVVRVGDDGALVIVDGEHRWRASKAAGLSEVYVSVREMTEPEAMVATVRRNVLRGSLDRVKFTDLVKKLVNPSTSVEEVRRRMGVQDREFARTFLGMTEGKKDMSASLSMADKNVAVSMAVANLSQTIREIVQANGETLPQGFVAFAYRGKVNLMISMDGPMQKAVQEFVAAAAADKLTQEEISEKLTTALKALS